MTTLLTAAGFLVIALGGMAAGCSLLAPVSDPEEIGGRR